MELIEPKISSYRALVIKGTASSFIIQVFFAGISLISAVVLARILGTENYGAYVNAMAWVGIFGVIASFGFGSLLVRDVAVLRSQGKNGELKGFLWFSDLFVTGLSIFLGIVVIFAAWITFVSPEKAVMKNSLQLASLLIPLSALATLRQSAIRGLEHITHSMLPDLILRPVLILICVIALYYLFPHSLNSMSVIGISAISALITLGLSSYWLQRYLPSVVSHVQPIYDIKNWLSSAFPMLVYVGLQMIIAQTPTVMLGLQKSATDVGLFSVAFRISTMLTFFIGAVHTVMGPIMARLNANGEKEHLQRLLTITVWASFLLTLLLGLGIVFGSDFILAIFGHEYIVAKLSLVILIIGNLVDIATGSPALLLVMTGHERSVAYTYIVITVINIILNAFFIQLQGYEGAALASVFSLVISRLILVIYSLRHLHLNTTIFSSIKI